MLSNILQAIQSRIIGWIVLALFILSYAVYFTMLSYSIPRLMSASDGLPIFDMSRSGFVLSFIVRTLLFFAASVVDYS